MVRSRSPRAAAAAEAGYGFFDGRAERLTLSIANSGMPTTKQHQQCNEPDEAEHPREEHADNKAAERQERPASVEHLTGHVRIVPDRRGERNLCTGRATCDGM